MTSSGSPSLEPIWMSDEAWFEKLKTGERSPLYVIVIDIDDATSGNAIPSFAALLDGEDRDRAARFHFDKDRDRFIVAHALLRLVAGRAIGVNPSAVAFRAGPRAGVPPRLAPGAGLVPTLSLSHADHFVAVALGWIDRLGIDVEGRRTLKDVDALARAALTPAEAADFAALPPDRRSDIFLRWWTAKEAALKAEETGLATALDKVALDYDDTHLPRAAVVSGEDSSRRYPIRVFDPFGSSNAIAAVAAAKSAALNVTYTTAQTVLRLAQAKRRT
jgi:4'-phosphopantetheinyl transferase